MTTAAKSYFRYHLRSKWKLLLCIIVIALVLTAWNSAEQKYEGTHYDYKTETVIDNYVNYYCTLDTSLAVLIVCSCVLPVTEFSIFKKRRNLDCFYSLPISRRQMGIVHYLSGLFCLVVTYSCAFLANFLFLLRYPEGYDFGALICYYFLSLWLGVCAYSVNVFLFNRANTTWDGICFMILWQFAISAIIGTCNSISMSIYEAIVSDREYSYEIWSQKWKIPGSEMASPFSALFEVEWFYSDLIEKDERTSVMDLWGSCTHIGWLLFQSGIGIASVLGFVFSFGKGRTEKTEEVSDSWFGFKLMIPLYATLLTISSFGAGIILTLIATFIAYIIYRKGFHLKLSDWLVLAALFHLSFFMVFIDILIFSAIKG